MESVTDEGVQSVVLMWASQTGKTEIVNNICGYFMDADPSPILIVQPTIDRAKEWSKERLAPMVRDCTTLRGKVRSPRSRDSSNTILTKSFPGGSIAIAGANAPSGLAARPRRVVLLDEIDRFDDSAGTEGDPCALAERRTETFWNAVVVKTSTPTVKGMSRVEVEWEQSDQRRWFCPCPKCGEFQYLKWSQVQWPKGEPENSHYVCEKCGHAIDDEGRRKMVMAGEWRATAMERGRRGYHLNGIASLFRHKRGYRNRLHQMAADHIAAVRKGKQTLKTWVNTFLAETYEDETEKIEATDLMKNREEYSQPPSTVLVITAGADVQQDRVEIEVTGWGDGEESWGLGYFTVPGSPFEESTWMKVDEVLTQKWTRADGAVLGIKAALVDTGGTEGAQSWQSQVLRYTKPRFGRSVIACKGGSRPGSPIVGKVSRSGTKRSAILIVGTDSAKVTIMQRLKMTEFGPGFMHFTSDPKAGFGENFFSMLTAEEAVKEFRNGFMHRKWKKTKARNEALDCRVYSYAALLWLNINWAKEKIRIAKTFQKTIMPSVEQLEMQRIAKVDEAQTVASDKPIERERARPARRGGSWSKSWRRF